MPTYGQNNQLLEGYGTLTAAAGGLYGLGLLACIAPLVQPSFRWDGDIISRAVLLAYPKERETLIYLLGCILIPLAALLAVAAWRGCSRRVSPRLDALAHLPLAAWTGFLFTGQGPLWAWLAGALLVHLALRTALAAAGQDTPATGPVAEHRPALSPAAPEWAAARARIILAGAACGLSLFPRALETMDPKFAAIGRSITGIALLTTLWLLLAAFARPGPAVRVRARATTLSRAFQPLILLLLRHFMPDDRTWFPWIAAAAVAASVAWLILLLRSRDEAPQEMAVHRGLRRFWWVLVPLAIYAVAYVHETSARVDLYHEGERIVPPMATSRGAVPYRDVFLWHGLFENDIKGRLAFGLVEETVSGMRRFEALLEPLAAVAFLFLARACLGSPLGGLVATLLLLHWVAPANARYALPYAAFALLATWLHLRARGIALPAGAGVLAALAVFHSLDGGMGALVSGMLLLVYGALCCREESAPATTARIAGQATAFLAGAAAGSLIPLAWLAAGDALVPFLDVSGEIIFGLSDRSSHPYAALMPVVGRPAKLLVTYLPAIIVFWGLGHMAARGGAGLRRALPALAVPLAGALVFYRAVIRRPDMDHVIKLTPLILLVLLMLIAHHGAGLFAARRGAAGRVISLAALVPLCVFLLLLGAYQAETAPGKSIRALKRDPPLISGVDAPMRELRLKRAGPGVADVEHSARWIESVTGFLHEQLGPDEPFYDFTNMGLFHFLADRPAPTRYVQTTYAASREAQLEVVRDLEEQQPRFVTFPSGNMRKYDYDRILHPLRHPLISRYLYDHYRPHTVIGDTMIIVRNDTPGYRETEALVEFLGLESFASSLGQLPRLFGEQPAMGTTVLEWDAAEIAARWRRIGPVRSGSKLAGSSFALGSADPARQPRLTSPPLDVAPAGTDALLLRLSAEEDLEVVLHYRPASEDHFTNRGRVSFIVTGDGTPRDYRVDLGLLPNWVWRGTVAAVQIRIQEKSGPLHIERVALLRLPADA